MTSKALLVGLNAYPNPSNSLRGCLNDVLQMSRMLQESFRFDDPRQIRVLTDHRATTSAIKERLRWLVDSARAGDVLVFHYSGHGSQVPDRHGDESDGLDEIICPYDLDWDDPFTDDDLFEIVRGLPASVNLTVILDSCHSGTGLREATGSGRGARRRWMPPPARLGGPVRADALMRRFGAKAVECGAILIAGCRSDQSSADADIGGEYHGALTFYLCRAIEELGFGGSYRTVIGRTRHLLQLNGYEQVPQLEGPPALLHGEILAARYEAVGA